MQPGQVDQVVAVGPKLGVLLVDRLRVLPVPDTSGEHRQYVPR
jgi:hypothetical protein